MSSTLPLELTTLLVFWLCLSTWQRNFQVAARRLFIGLTLACAAWCVGDICYWSDLLGPLEANRITFLGVLTIPALWLGLAAYAAEIRLVHDHPRLPLLLMAPCACAYPLLYIESWTHVFFQLDADGSAEFGPALWCVAVYSWMLMGLASALFFVAATHLRGPGRWARRVGVVLAGVFPLVVDIVFAMLESSWKHDPVPIAMGAALLILHGAIFSGGLLNTLPISQLDLVTHLPVPVLITDRHGAVIDANPAACARLGLTVHRTLSRSIDDVLLKTPDQPESEVRPIVAHGREIGQFVLLDPPSKPGPREAKSTKP